MFLTIRVGSRRYVGVQDPPLLDQVLPELEDDEPAEEQDGPHEAEAGEHWRVLQVDHENIVRRLQHLST